MHEKRFYRDSMKADGLIGFNISVEESDLQISAKTDLSEKARCFLKSCRQDIKDYIEGHPELLRSLVPIEPQDDAPQIIKDMCDAGKLAGVGPMAAVAGAISQHIGRELISDSEEIIIENGGDIFIRTKKERCIAIYAGDSIFSNKIGFKIPRDFGEGGICTSSGTIGHSLSFGKADAVAVVSKDVIIADAVATAVGNKVKNEDYIKKGLEFAMSIPEVEGVIIIVGHRIGAYGKIEIVRF